MWFFFRGLCELPGNEDAVDYAVWASTVVTAAPCFCVAGETSPPSPPSSLKSVYLFVLAMDPPAYFPSFPRAGLAVQPRPGQGEAARGLASGEARARLVRWGGVTVEPLPAARRAVVVSGSAPCGPS